MNNFIKTVVFSLSVLTIMHTNAVNEVGPNVKTTEPQHILISNEAIDEIVGEIIRARKHNYVLYYPEDNGSIANDHTHTDASVLIYDWSSNSNLRENLKKICQKHNFTQEQLAEAVLASIANDDKYYAKRLFCSAIINFNNTSQGSYESRDSYVQRDNIKIAIACLKEAAELEYVEAMFELGATYNANIISVWPNMFTKYDAKTDKEKIDIGMKYLTDAAKLGHADAQFYLATKAYYITPYKQLEEIPLSKTFEERWYWIIKAARQEHHKASKWLNEAKTKIPFTARVKHPRRVAKIEKDRSQIRKIEKRIDDEMKAQK